MSQIFKLSSKNKDGKRHKKGKYDKILTIEESSWHVYGCSLHYSLNCLDLTYFKFLKLGEKKTSVLHVDKSFISAQLKTLCTSTLHKSK